MNNSSNTELTGLNSSGNSVSSLTKCDRLKSCIIKLTELSNKERNHWMSSSSHSMTTTPEMDGTSTSTNDSRYNMRARPPPSESGTRSTGRKRAVVNYRELGHQDSGHDSDYEATLKPPQPLDIKRSLSEQNGHTTHD